MTVRTSLVRQVVLSIVLAELVCMCALTVISIVHERQVRLRAIDVSLGGRADSLFGAVQDAEDAGDTVMLDPREIQLPAEDFFAVYDKGGRLLGSSPNAPGVLLRPGQVGLRTVRVEGHTYRVLQQRHMRIIDRAETSGVGLERPVTILYASTIDGVWRQVFAGVGFFLGASVVLIAGTTLLMIHLMRRILEPLRELAAAAAAVSARELVFSAPPSALQVRELRPLAATLSATITDLKAAFERQHRFVGDAAHELKTAVAVVRSALQVMLVRPRSTAEYGAGIATALRDNGRLEELVSRMLLLARVEETTAQMRCDLGAAAREAVERLRPTVEMAGLALEVHVSETSTVALDANDVEVLLGNLMMNAVEHSAPGGGVGVEVGAQDGVAALRVEDRGEGIPAEALTHLFERFYRVDSSRARTTGGSGLGLSIAKAIVEGAGGSIGIRSTPGEGTVVEVTLPRVEELPSGGVNLGAGE